MFLSRKRKQDIQDTDKRIKGVIVMMKGVLNVEKDQVYVTNQTGKISLASGQPLYLLLQDCRIPVVVVHSPKTHQWCFQYLDRIAVGGQKVLVDQ